MYGKLLTHLRDQRSRRNEDGFFGRQVGGAFISYIYTINIDAPINASYFSSSMIPRASTATARWRS